LGTKQNTNREQQQGHDNQQASSLDLADIAISNFDFLDQGPNPAEIRNTPTHNTIPIKIP